MHCPALLARAVRNPGLPGCLGRAAAAVLLASHWPGACHRALDPAQCTARRWWPGLCCCLLSWCCCACWWPAPGQAVRLIQPGALPRSAAVLVLFAINEIAACACLAWPRGRFTFKRPSTQRPTSPGQPLARQAMAAPGAFWWPALGRARAAVRLIQPGALPGPGLCNV